MALKPANYVIQMFGGVRATARALRLTHGAVAKWPKPRDKRGCGGLIPSCHHKKILDVAEILELNITPQHLVYGGKAKK